MGSCGWVLAELTSEYALCDMIWPWSSTIILLILPNPHFSAKPQPFYCKIRRLDCTISKYTDHICCSTKNDESVTSSTTDNADVTEKNEDPQPTMSISAKNDAADIEHGEILESQPSQIDQVVLTLGDSAKVNELPETNQKYAPKFCTKLKFSCNTKQRQSHACCRYPLPPDSYKQRNKSPISKLKTSKTKEENSSQSVPQRPTLIKKRPLLRKPLIRPTNNFSVKERINSFDPKSAAVCKIIKCERNPRHRCCQKTDTTTEFSTTTFSSEANTNTEAASTSKPSTPASTSEVSTTTTFTSTTTTTTTTSTTTTTTKTATTTITTTTTSTSTSTAKMMTYTTSSYPVIPVLVNDEDIYTMNEAADITASSTMKPTNDGFEMTTKENISRNSMSNDEFEEDLVTTEDNLEKLDDGKTREEEKLVFYDDINLTVKTSASDKFQKDDDTSDNKSEISAVSDLRESKHLLTPRFGSNSISGSDKDSYKIFINSVLVPNQIAPRVSPECFRFDCLSIPDHKCCNSHLAIKRHTEDLDDIEELSDSKDSSNKEETKDNLNFVNSRVTATITRMLKSFSWL